jgi:hypothetical protein
MSHRTPTEREERDLQQLAPYLSCPKNVCQGKVRPDPGAQYARILRCLVCGFAFRVTNAMVRRTLKGLGIRPFNL